LDYTIPAATRIGHVHLKVSDIPRALKFYQELLGFQIMQWYEKEAVFLSAGGYHHHIALNTWFSKKAPPAPKSSVGLFHTAIVFPTRKDLADILRRLLEVDYPITGLSDHGVSEAIYCNDPDGNGVELYWDRPREFWPRDDKGSLVMVTEALDVKGLLAELDR